MQAENGKWKMQNGNYLTMRRRQRIEMLRSLIRSIGVNRERAAIELRQLDDIPGGELSDVEIKWILHKAFDL